MQGWLNVTPDPKPCFCLWGRVSSNSNFQDILLSVGDLVTAWQNPFFSTIFFYFIKLILVEDPALSKAPVVTGQTSSQQVSSVRGTSLHPASLPLASYFLPCILAPCLILPPLHPASLPLASYFLPCILPPSSLPHTLSLHPIPPPCLIFSLNILHQKKELYAFKKIAQNLFSQPHLCQVQYTYTVGMVSRQYANTVPTMYNCAQWVQRQKIKRNKSFSTCCVNNMFILLTLCHFSISHWLRRRVRLR